MTWRPLEGVCTVNVRPFLFSCSKWHPCFPDFYKHEKTGNIPAKDGPGSFDQPQSMQSIDLIYLMVTNSGHVVNRAADKYIDAVA